MLLPLAQSVAQHKALMFGVGLTSAKTALADLATQTVVEHRGLHELDVRRIGIFAFYGLLYLGAFQFFLYSVVFPLLFPNAAAFAALPLAAKLRDRAGQTSVLCQVALDQGLHWPGLAIPAFYVIKGAGEQRGPLASLRSCREVWREDVQACWAIWVPASLINFSCMPVHLRIHFAAFVSFGYTCLVSVRRGRPTAHRREPAGRDGCAVGTAVGSLRGGP